MPGRPVAAEFTLTRHRLATVTARRSPHAADVAIALGTWAFACGLLLLLPLLEATDAGLPRNVAPVGASGWWLTVTVLSLQSTALLGARAVPRAALVMVSALPLLAAGAVDTATFSLTRTATAVAVFLAGLLLPAQKIWSTIAVAATLIAAGDVVNQMVAGHPGVVVALAQTAAQTIAVVLAPLLVAFVFAARREAREAHLNELRAVVRERDALMAAAVSKERAAMARELHDIAAHHLSGIAVMAAAVDRQIDTNPEAARRAVRQVRAQTKAVLDDLRRLVGLLRDDADAERQVQTLATVADLVRDRQAAGMQVEMRSLTEPDDRIYDEGIGPLAQLVAYRMVQESLTNAATHAPGASCRVEIDYRDAAGLTVTVANEPAPTIRSGGSATSHRDGFGLLGMRERATLIAAQLRYGAAADGGWTVVLTIPRDDRHGNDLPGSPDPEKAK